MVTGPDASDSKPQPKKLKVQQSTRKRLVIKKDAIKFDLVRANLVSANNTQDPCNCKRANCESCVE